MVLAGFAAFQKEIQIPCRFWIELQLAEPVAQSVSLANQARVFFDTDLGTQDDNRKAGRTAPMAKTPPEVEIERKFISLSSVSQVATGNTA